jgi:hypothetical protein
MEIYNFYLMATMIASLFAQTETRLPIYGLIGGVLLWAGAFILQGFGIAKMAKNRGLKNRALAFVPFVNIWYIGKLAGEAQFFGQKVKRAGMYAMIAQIIATIFTLVMIAAEVYLWLNHGAPQMETQLGAAYWPGLTGFSLTVSKFYDLSGYLTSILQLVCGIFLVILLMSLYKKYEPRNHFALSMLTLLVPVSRFIILFVIRGRKAIDYEAYMRARQEAYIRRRQQYYNQYNGPYNRQGGNPYGGQYGQNPYGQNPYGQNAGQAPPKSEEPFEEFSSRSSGQNSSQNYSSRGGNSDGFFD